VNLSPFLHISRELFRFVDIKTDILIEITVDNINILFIWFGFCLSQGPVSNKSSQVK